MGPSSRPNAPDRSGLSLLEILISVFVLSIGLLGVAAVIPLGGHQIVETAKYDRASACGRAGLHDIKTRGWLNPAVWRQLAVNEYDPTTGGFHWEPRTFPVIYDSSVAAAIPLGDSFAIDPLFFSHRAPDHDNGLNPLVWRFPLDATEENIITEERRSSLIRVTLFNFFDYSISPFTTPDPPFMVPRWRPYRMPFAAANRVFTWRDDMLFPIPDDPEDRPRQLLTWDGGQGLAYPRRDTDGGPPASAPLSAILSQADDNYSWMATVTPILDGPGHDFWVKAPIPDSHHTPLSGDPSTDPWTTTNYWKSYAYLNKVTRYTVSIVVFYKRDFVCPLPPLTGLDPEFPPQERTVMATFPGDGFGGGDVFLYYDPAPANNPLLKTEKWLDVKKNDWIMLRGLESVPQMRDPEYPVGATSANWNPFRRVVAKWYRVVAVDDVVDEMIATVPVKGRYVTLSGPDWRVDNDGDGRFEPTGWLPHTNGNTDFDPARATLVDNVIGVYTTSVEVDFGSVWTQ